MNLLFVKNEAFQIILKTIYLFLKKNKINMVIIILIFVMTIFMNRTDIQLNFVKIDLNQKHERNDIKNCIINIFLLEIICSFLQRFRYFLLTFTINRFFHELSIQAIENTIEKDELTEEALQNGFYQKSIEIGAKGMSKLVSVCVLNLLNVCVSIIMLSYKTWDTFDAIFSYIILAFNIIYAATSIYFIFLRLKFKKRINQIKCKINNKLHELLKNHEAIKTNATEDFELREIDLFYIEFEKESNRYKIMSSVIIFTQRTIISCLKITSLMICLNKYENDKFLNKKIVSLRSLIDFSEKKSKNAFDFYDEIKAQIVNSRMILSHIKNSRPHRTTPALEQAPKKITFDNFEVDCYIQKKPLVGIYTFEKGDRIAFLGSNGTGKTSFFRSMLLLNGYDGVINIDGVDISGLNKQNIRKLYGSHTQKIYLFNKDAAYNIKYGNDDISEKKVEEILEVLDLDLKINSEENLNSKKKSAENQFSMGEKQKIMLARTLIDKKFIYLLDEPFNHMDSRTIKNILNYFYELSDSIIFVSFHNYDYLKYFNKFLYIDNENIKYFDHIGKITNFLNNRLDIKRIKID